MYKGWEGGVGQESGNYEAACRLAVWADQPTVTAAAMLHSGLCLHLYSERLQHSVACVIDRADNRR